MIQLINEKGTKGILFFNFILMCFQNRGNDLMIQCSFILKIHKIELGISLAKEKKNAKAIKESVKEAIQNAKNNVASA